MLSFRWLRDPRLVVPAAGVGLVAAGTVAYEQAEPLCTTADPCGPDPVGAILLGLMCGAVVAAYAYRRLVPGLVAAAAVMFMVADQIEEVMPWWADLALAAYVAVCSFAASTGRRPARAARIPGAAVLGCRPPPRPARVPVINRRWLAAAGLATAAAGTLLWWGVNEQARRDAQQRTAPVVAAVVREHPDDFTVRVALPDGRQVDVNVLESADHPVGAELRLHVDDRGLRQPVTEPYDASGWLWLATIAGSVGLAAGLRSAERNRALRRLLAAPQPVRAALAVEDLREVHVILPGVRSDLVTVVTVPTVATGLPDGHPTGSVAGESRGCLSAGFDCPGCADCYAGQALDPPVPALLYGDPGAGGWCAVEIADRLRLPRGPAEPPVEVPADEIPGLPATPGSP